MDLSDRAGAVRKHEPAEHGDDPIEGRVRERERVPVHDARLDVSNAFTLEMRLESFDHLLGKVHGDDFRESRRGAEGEGSGPRREVEDGALRRDTEVRDGALDESGKRGAELFVIGRRDDVPWLGLGDEVLGRRLWPSFHAWEGGYTERSAPSTVAGSVVPRRKRVFVFSQRPVPFATPSYISR